MAADDATPLGTSCHGSGASPAEVQVSGSKEACLTSSPEMRISQPSGTWPRARVTSALERETTTDEFGDVPLGGATTLTEEQQLGLFHSQVNMMIENEK